ncbi:MAG: hypothetical protein DRQ54_09385 [Gammaproteobacteria bacterium]|nr:MAG: hypothetical protein DRQ54_09385 [Gammaproteobacteria bacterium]
MSDTHAVFNRILVPIDCIEPSKAVLDYAVELAQQHDGELILVYVLENPIFPVEMMDIDLRMEEVAEHAGARLATLVTNTIGDSVRHRHLVAQGSVSDQIVAAADREQADVIIMGTDEHSDLRKFLIGSITERVVRHAHQPVLALHVKK